MILKRHNMASVLIVQALQKGPCGANQIAYTGIGSTNYLSEQGLDLRNTANKTLPYWLLPNLTAHAIKASSRPDAILFLPSTVCSSRVTTRISNLQQLATDKKLILNQWEVHLIEFKFCEDTGPDPQLPNSPTQKATAQHSVLLANLNRQGYRELWGLYTKTIQLNLGKHCNTTQATTVKVWVWVLQHTTPLTHINYFLIVCAAWCGHQHSPLP
jgi:hypothetical protein